MSERAQRSEQGGASEQESGASEKENGRARGPVLQSVFLAVMDHSELPARMPHLQRELDDLDYRFF